MDRDPRNDPQRGDAIVQRNTLARIVVTNRDGESVEWRSKWGCMVWTLRAWRDVVARGSTISRWGPGPE